MKAWFSRFQDADEKSQGKRFWSSVNSGKAVGVARKSPELRPCGKSLPKSAAPMLMTCSLQQAETWHQVEEDGHWTFGFN